MNQQTDHGADARLAFEPLVRKSFSPGPGWQHMAGAVWERGPLRVHLGGIVRLADGTIISEKAVHRRYQQVALLIRINGGNRKRGLLAWGRLLGEFVATRMSMEHFPDGKTTACRAP